MHHVAHSQYKDVLWFGVLTLTTLKVYTVALPSSVVPGGCSSSIRLGSWI